MKVNPFNNVQQNPYRKQVDRSEKVSEVKAKRDQIEISNVAKELQESNKIEAARQEKVQQLKEQIDSGEYKVDAKAVARKFYEYWNQ